jgi:hypothetical protein
MADTLTRFNRRLTYAAAQARQTAGARHERTLFAVACSRLFGLVPVPGELEERFLRPSLTS